MPTLHFDYGFHCFTWLAVSFSEWKCHYINRLFFHISRKYPTGAQLLSGVYCGGYFLSESSEFILGKVQFCLFYGGPFTLFGRSRTPPDSVRTMDDMKSWYGSLFRSTVCSWMHECNSSGYFWHPIQSFWLILGLYQYWGLDRHIPVSLLQGAH